MSEGGGGEEGGGKEGKRPRPGPASQYESVEAPKSGWGHGTAQHFGRFPGTSALTKKGLEEKSPPRSQETPVRRQKRLEKEREAWRQRVKSGTRRW
jgi:hypothetical protein